MKRRTSKDTALRTGRIRSILLPILILAAAGLVVYANSLSNSFVWDDEALVIDNPSIRSLQSLPRIFAEKLFPEIPGGNFYRPVQTSSYALDYFFWGLDPLGYHLANLLIHLANGVLIYLILLMVTERRSIAFAASLLFIIHPINTEAVDYISGRADLLAALFICASWFLFLAWNRPEGKGKLILPAGSIVFFILALLTKEGAIIFPLLALISISCSGRKGQAKRPFRLYFGSLFMISAAYLAIRALSAFNTGTPFSSNPYPFYQRFLSSFKVLIGYLGILFLPLHLRMERVVPIEGSFFSPGVILPLLLISALIMTAVKIRRHSRVAFFAFAWFLIALLPYLNWFPLNAEMAEHWLYLPSAGFFLLLALGVERTVGRKYRRGIICLSILIALSLSALTIDRNCDWRDNETIYTVTARSSPESPRAHYNLGNIHLGRGEAGKAAAEFREAIRLKPWDASYHKNLGKALLELGLVREAVREYERAVELEPNSAGGRTALGAAYGMAGMNRKAVRELKAAIKLDPGQAEAYNNLGSVYTNLGRFNEALAEYDKALRINPGYLDAIFNRGVVYYHLGERKAAISQFDRVLELQKGHLRASRWRKKAKLLRQTQPSDNEE